MIAETPLLHPSGLVRCDDVYSVLLDHGDVLYQIAVRFRDEDHMHYVARLRWRTFRDDKSFFENT